MKAQKDSQWSRLKGLGLVLMLVALLSIAARCGEAPLGSADNPIVMAFVPSVETQQLLETVTPLVAMMEEETGYHIEAMIPTDYATVIEGMGTGKVDVAQLSPLAYVLANQKYGAQTILTYVRYGRPFYKGQIVVRADSGIESLKDLQGKKFAFVDPASTSGHLYPKALMIREGYDPERFFDEAFFAGGHDKALIALVDGQVDGAAVYDGARDLMTEIIPDIMEVTKVIAETESIPNDTIVVRQDLPSEMVEKLRDALLTIANTEEGKELLKNPYKIDGFVPSQDSDYDPVRLAAEALNIDLEEEVKKAP
ncbi:MAG: phosphate/phosphite/phosphonate ABC transporter substrate-binding protein [Anaerolineae bacterium]